MKKGNTPGLVPLSLTAARSVADSGEETLGQRRVPEVQTVAFVHHRDASPYLQENGQGSEEAVVANTSSVFPALAGP